jgi:hypothetical protein
MVHDGATERLADTAERATAIDEFETIAGRNDLMPRTSLYKASGAELSPGA